MRENRTKAKWRSGEPTFGGWLTIPSPSSAEIMAHAGFDYVCVDMQHGAIDYQVALTMLTAISTSAATPFVRVPWNEPGIIGKVLDAGAMGVIIPMTNTVSEVQSAVAACRYAPVGARSYGPGRVTLYAGADYFAHANEEIACVPMVETTQALGELDAILAVPGVDAIYVGPSDLSISLGLPPGLDNGGAFEDARVRISEACRERRVTAGIHATALLAAKHVAAGYRMITIGGDAVVLAAGAAADVRAAHTRAS